MYNTATGNIVHSINSGGSTGSGYCMDIDGGDYNTITCNNFYDNDILLLIVERVI